MAAALHPACRPSYVAVLLLLVWLLQPRHHSCHRLNCLPPVSLLQVAGHLFEGEAAVLVWLALLCGTASAHVDCL